MRSRPTATDQAAKKKLSGKKSSRINIRPSVSIIGSGKVGTALAYLLKQADYSLVEIAAGSELSAKTAKKYLKNHSGIKIVLEQTEKLFSSDLILIAVPDTKIKKVCDKFSDRWQEGSIVVHVSGAVSVSALDSARDRGALTGAFHPIQSCPDIKTAIRNIPQCYFGITAENSIPEASSTANRNSGSHKVLTVLKRLGKDIGKGSVIVADKDKTQYHAACVFASNYLVGLAASVEITLTSLSYSDIPLNAMLPLMNATLANIEKLGTGDALTGPIVRGDAETLKVHIKAINKNGSPLDVYRSLGIAVVELARREKKISPKKARELKDILYG